MFLNLFCVAVALLVASPLLLSQISVLYLAKTPAGRCLLGVFPAPAWNVSVSESAETWISPPLLLLPLLCFWVLALCPSHPGDAPPESAYLGDARWPTGWHQPLSCDPGPPQLRTGAGEMRASPRSETVPPVRLRFFSKQTVLDDMHDREQGMTQQSDSQRCFCLLQRLGWLEWHRRGDGSVKETLRNFLKTSKHSSVLFGVMKVTQRLSCRSQERLSSSVFWYLLSWPKIKTINDTYHFND